MSRFVDAYFEDFEGAYWREQLRSRPAAQDLLGLSVVTPAEIPQILDHHIAQARIDFDGDELPKEWSLLQLHARASVRRAESMLKRTLFDTVYEIAFSRRPLASRRPYYLPKPPVSEILAYQASDGVWVDSPQLIAENLLLKPDSAEVYPLERKTLICGLRYKAGYGIDWLDLPDDIFLGVLTLFAHYYREREAAVPGSVSETPMLTNDLLRPHIWHTFYEPEN